VIAFDRGDVAWLRGYCHFQAAIGEIFWAIDSQPFFEGSAHLLFEDVETPYEFLVEDRVPFDLPPGQWENDRQFLIDFLTSAHLLLRLQVEEPDR
jgi:hypothetical protein